MWELHQLEKILEVGAPSDERVIEKIEDFMNTLPALREASDAHGNVEIPVDVVRDVDQGKKPMGFMINQILAAGTVNEVRRDASGSHALARLRRTQRLTAQRRPLANRR